MESNEDGDASGSEDEMETTGLHLNGNGALPAEENEDNTTNTSSLKSLCSWQNMKNVVTVAMLWTAFFVVLVNKSLLTSFFPQEVNSTHMLANIGPCML